MQRNGACRKKQSSESSQLAGSYISDRKGHCLRRPYDQLTEVSLSSHLLIGGPRGGHGGHGPPFGAERWGHTIFWPHLSDRTKVLEKLFVCFIFFLAPSKDVNFTHEWAQFRILSIWRSGGQRRWHRFTSMAGSYMEYQRGFT